MNSNTRNKYQSPLVSRYASQEMLWIFSERNKILTWRKLWIALAKAEKDLGLNITELQIQEMQNCLNDIDFVLADKYEREIRHDVMAQIKAFSEKCPKASSIIHLGATSCFVCDNADLIFMREACTLLLGKLINLINSLSKLAIKYRELPTLAYTHFQPAQFTTVGKRTCLWINDLVMDLEDINYFIINLKFRGVKGTTGTQASYLKLFNGDQKKVENLDLLVTKYMNFEKSYPITGQTYPRKIDAKLLSILSGISTSASKFASDIRLLAHEREIEEPFLSKQVGSSAMAYKRNPMRCERISSLSRFVISLLDHTYHLAANQWLERTLDDSAGRRIVIPEAFLSVEALLNLYHSVIDGIQVNENVIYNNMKDELNFIATENILMDAVKAGGNRQKLHEKIRLYSIDTMNKMKKTGKSCDLISKLKMDDDFSTVIKNVDNYTNPSSYIGRAPKQVSDYINNVVDPLLKKHNVYLKKYNDNINY